MTDEVSTKSKAFKITKRLVGSLLLLWASVVVSPKLLAFPYHAQIGEILVYSEAPVMPHINGIIARSHSLLRQSTIYSEKYGKTIYLTNGGWRWQILSAPSTS
jgi:hypothetical protein